MKLYKALKLKNKLVGEINKLQSLISSKNSFIAGSDITYNVENLLTEWNSKKNKLISLKLAINEANNGIQENIYKLSEIKSSISLYNSLTTIKGKHYDGYSRDTVLEYDCQISEIEKENRIKNLEKQLEEIQESIDTYNYTIEIEFEN